MENQFDNTLVNEFGDQPKRPQFLTVLCILSFICAGLMFVITLFGVITNTPEKQQEQIEQMRQFSPATAEQFEATLLEQQNSVMAKIQPYLTILLILVSVFGVVQMFNLKKTGFYLYLAGELIPYIFMIVGGKQAMSMMGSMGGAVETAAIAVFVLMFVFDAVFIAMYAMNLKHMKQ